MRRQVGCGVQHSIFQGALPSDFTSGLSGGIDPSGLMRTILPRVDPRSCAGSNSLAVAGGDKERAVRSESQLASEMPSSDRFRRLPPNNLHVFELIAVKPPPRNGKALEHNIIQILIRTKTIVARVLSIGRLLGRGLGIGQVDELVGGEFWINCNIKQTALLVSIRPSARLRGA